MEDYIVMQTVFIDRNGNIDEAKRADFLLDEASEGLNIALSIKEIEKLKVMGTLNISLHMDVPKVKPNLHIVKGDSN